MAMTNICVISGRLVADPELRTTTNGKVLAKFSIANDVGFGADKKTTFFQCTAWGQVGKFLCDYGHKGDPVFCSGQIVGNNYVDKDGKKRVAFDYVVSDVQLTGGRRVQEEEQQ